MPPLGSPIGAACFSGLSATTASVVRNRPAIEAALSSAERVTFTGSYNISPTVSPDGRLLAFITRQGNGYKLATQDLETGAVATLTDTQDDESPSFAPNGRMIVYATRQQGRDVLMTTTTDGRIKTRLLTSGADMREPAWGPFQR